MRNPWRRFLCTINIHRYKAIRLGSDKGWECRDCKKRDFPDADADADSDSMKNIWSGGGGNVGPF